MLFLKVSPSKNFSNLKLSIPKLRFIIENIPIVIFPVFILHEVNNMGEFLVSFLLYNMKLLCWEKDLSFKVIIQKLQDCA